MIKTLKVTFSLALLLVFILVVNGQAAANQDPVFVGSDLTGKPCQGVNRLPGTFGVYDYTKRSYNLPKLGVVERYHFTFEVESLIKGATTNLPYGDIAYTLRAWPNHHRALNAMSRYHLKLKRQKKHIPIAAECWFQRAINYSPYDGTSYMLYATYLHRLGKRKSAETKYQQALELDPEDIQTHYNYGLLLVDLKRYKEAKMHATKAYNAKYPLPGLRNKLKNVGFWP